MKSLLSLVALLFVVSANTHAISLAFKLDIFSSGSSIYACNAGLVHPSHAKRVCYERDNPTRSCNPGVCNDDVQECNCVCTGDALNGSDAGEHTADFFTVSAKDWSDHGLVGANSSTRKLLAVGEDFVQRFTDADAYNRQLSSLVFNLGSERYGAVYFLDVCYRAPQISYPTNFNNGYTTNYTHDKQVTISDLTPGYTYEDLAGLKVKTVTSCTKKNGQEFTAHESGWRSFNANDVINYPETAITNQVATCKVRYYFKESNRSGVESLRLWNVQHAQVCTYTSFNDPASVE